MNSICNFPSLRPALCHQNLPEPRDKVGEVWTSSKRWDEIRALNVSGLIGKTKLLISFSSANRGHAGRSMKVLVFPAHERLVPVSNECSRIYIPSSSLPTHVFHQVYQSDLLWTKVMKWQNHRHRTCAWAAPLSVVGLTSAPLRCIIYILFPGGDKANFLKILFDSLFLILSVLLPGLPRSYHVFIRSDLPDAAESTIQQALRKVMELMSYVYHTVCNLQNFLESG